MPNWKTHLEISKRINEKYKFKGIDYKKFLFGSILPDINNNHVVQDISIVFEHQQTHFCFDSWKGYLKFYSKYKTQIDNKDPLFIGYVTHLYTDYVFNNNFYTSLEEKNYLKTDKEILRLKKWNDFNSFNDKFVENYIDIDESSLNEIEILLEDSKKILEVSVNLEDIKRVIDFLKKPCLYGNKLQYYTEKELESLLNKAVVDIIEKRC